DLCEQRGGDVDVRDPTLEQGCGESGQVGDDATPDGDYDIGSAEPGPGEVPTEVLDDGQRLGLLPVGHVEPVGRDTRVHGDPDAGLGDDGGPGGIGQHRSQDAGQLPAGIVVDQDVVTALPQLHGHRPHRPPPVSRPAAASTRSTTSAGARSSTSTTAAATDAYRGRRTASSSRMARAGSSPSNGRPPPLTTPP